MTRLLKLFLVVLIGIRFRQIEAQEACTISTNDQQTLYEINEDFGINVPIFRLTVSPSNALVAPEPIIGGPLQSRYRWRFRYQLESPGNVILIANESLLLPNYPSTFVAAALQFKLLCNNQEYAAASVKIQNVNTYAPQFYRTSSYVLNISEATRPGTSFDLPVLIIDWDPSFSYTVSLSDQSGNWNNTFTLIDSGNIQDLSTFSTELQDLQSLHENAKPAQLPKLWKLVLNRPLDFEYGTRIYTLYLEATDNGGSDGLEPKTNFSQFVINVMDFDDRPPTFFSGSYRANISLGAEPGTEVIFDPKILAVDGDPAIQSPILYSFVPDRWTEFFSINETSGAVFMAKKLPQDISQSSFDLVLLATERDNNNRRANAYAHIDVIYSGQSVPVFAQCSYEAKIQENTVLGAQVVQLLATDSDKGDYGRFTFHLLNTSDAQPFQIDVDTGVISVKNPEFMDRETQETFRFQAELIPYLQSERVRRQTGSDPDSETGVECAQATILVTLIDENDNSPVFTEGGRYTITIRDTVAKNTEIGAVDARDKDAGANGVVTYEPIEQDPRDSESSVMFRGDRNVNGSLMILVDFDAVNRPKFMPDYQLFVEAKDSGNPPRSSRAKIVVTVKFSNSHVPVFPVDQYRINLPENTPINTQVLQVEATDPDEGDSGSFLYALTEDAGGALRVDKDTGWISVGNSSVLDREARESVVVKVSTIPLLPPADGEIIPMGPTEATVVINLEDVNDNSPVFVLGPDFKNVTNEYKFDIDNTWKDYIGMVKATDADSGDFGIVTLNAVSVPRFFSFESDGSIGVKEPLPENPEPVYTLVIEAYDSPNHPNDRKRTVATVKIFVEESAPPAPTFVNLPYSIPVSEAMALKSLVYSVIVTGRDPSSLEFEIAAGNTNDTFGMNRNVIYVQKRLDAEILGSFDLEILAKDGELETRGNLRIDVQDSNDNPPVFEKTLYDFDISGKSIETGLIVGSVSATDSDLTEANNVIKYSLDLAASEFLLIDESEGEISVKAPLPTGLQQYGFSVSATDNGDPPLQGVAYVTIQLTSTSSRPKFTQLQYAVDVEENLAPKPVLTLLATHPRLKPTYKWSQNTFPEFFAINSADGTVSTLKSLDFEENSEYQLIASACILLNTTTNVSLCDEASVIVRVEDANDHAPAFSQSVYYARIPNNTAVGTDVLRVEATDEDSNANGDVSYALITPSAFFRIEYDTGIVETASEMINGFFNMTVEAFDHGNPAKKAKTSVLVIVNGSNPNAPEFEQFTYRGTVPENATVGTRILTLRAFDRDPVPEGIVSLSYQFSNDSQTIVQSGNFTLNSTTGDLFTNMILDYETQREYRLVIEAVDSSPMYPRSSTTVAQIDVSDVNDHAPVFQPLPNRMYISSAKAPGSLILEVHATDGDGEKENSEIVYSVVTANGSFFAMTENRLTVNQSLIGGTYELEIGAKDTGNPAKSTTHPLTVVVIVDREKYPVFEELAYPVTLYKNATLPQTVHKFEAEVQSGSVRYEFLGGVTPAEGLKLNAETGDLDAEPELLNNVPMNEALFFVIRAVNAEATDYFSDVMVKLTVSDDSIANIPLVFPSALFRGTMKENMPAGTSLNMTVEVVEPELFQAKLRYWLEPNDTFSIDSRGNIFAHKEVDLEAMSLESGGIYFLNVYASNGTVKTSAKLEIRIDDVDEIAPIFDKDLYEVGLREDWAPGRQIVMVTATDGDFTDRNGLEYAVTGGDAADYAYAQDFGLILKTEAPMFDREMKEEMFLTVTVNDKAGNTANTTVKIILTDVNDNTPQFVGTPYFWNVTEGTQGLSQKFPISATDLDLGQNGNVSFKILQGNLQGLFLLENFGNNKAEVSVIQELDREARSGLLLTIEARDNGEPSLFNITSIEIDVIDVNDNPPRFYRKTYEAKVPSSFPTDFTILTVYALDPDKESKLQYNIMEDLNSGGLFEMDSKQGLLKFAKKPPKTSTTYSLQLNVTDGRFSDTVNVSIQVYLNDGSSGNSTEGKVNLPPVFRENDYNFTVGEGELGARVGLVSAVDPDSSEPVLLNIEPPEYKELFEIQEPSGYLVTKVPLSYSKTVESYNFLVTAMDRGNPPLSAFAQIRVYVRDINNNVPVFSRQEYTALVPPNASKGFSVPLGIQAVDEDAGLNAKIRYSLTGKDADCFLVEVHEPQLSLQCLPDFYAQKSYSLQINATDRDGDGNSSYANLTVLVAPPFELTTLSPVTGNPNETMTTATVATMTTAFCKISLPSSPSQVVVTETTPVGAPVFHASTAIQVSGDCTPEYRLTGNAKDYFYMDRKSGTVSLAQKLSLDKLKEEGLFNGTLANNTIQFEIEISTGNEVLKMLQLQLTIIKRNISSGLIFEQEVYRFVLKEEEEPGVLVGMVKAQNLNFTHNITAIEYAVNFGEDLFEIGNVTAGNIVSRKKLDSDGDKPKEYSFIVQATQGIMNDYASVIVTMEDINDNSPQFTQSSYMIQIPEAPYGAGGSVIKDIYATDGDSGTNALLNFSIETTDQNLPFSIGASNGQLRIFGDIDRETKDTYFFYLVATDNGSPPLSTRVPVNVTISDVNDHSPVFDQGTQAVSIRERGPSVERVAVVRATDLDEGENGQIQYQLTNFREDFSVDSKTGLIETAHSLDYSKQKSYFLQVEASDLGRPRLVALANITVEVVEFGHFKPKFMKEMYYVDLNKETPPGKTFLALTAGVDPLTYGFSGYRGDLFSITKESGMMSFGRIPLTEETQRRYELTVVAVNETSGDNASTVVSVFVPGTTDSPRAFEESIYNAAIQENNKPNSLIIDLNSTYELRSVPVRYSLVSNLSGFVIEEATGKLFVTKSLDREERSHYPIRVRAVPTSVNKRDLLNVANDQTLVFLNVTDVNDNPPRFITATEGPIILKVLSEQQIGTPIGFIRADDPDFRSELTFRINEGKDSDKFRLVPRSGQVLAAVNFATTDKEIFEFSVSAFDNDNVHETKGTVKVFKLTSSNQAILVSELPRSSVEKYIAELQRQLRELTGFNVTVTHVMDHTEEGAIYFNKSDIYVHASDPKTQKPVSGSELAKRLGLVLPKLQTNMQNLKLSKVKQPEMLKSRMTISPAEIALIVICCVIILTAILVCCVMFKWWKRRETEKVSSEYMIDSHSSGPRPYDTETLDRKTAASLLSAQTGIFAHPSRSVVSNVGRYPMSVPYDYEEDSSGASNGSVISRPFLYYGNYHRYQPHNTVSTASS